MKQDYKVIGTYITNTPGWEYDQIGFIIEQDGKVGIMETSHGTRHYPEFGDEALKRLEEWKKQYQEELDTISAAIVLIK